MPRPAKSDRTKSVDQAGGLMRGLVRPEHLETCLAAARAKDPNDFIRDERAWLGAHLGLLSLAVQAQFERIIVNRTPEDADRLLYGSFLGGSVVRLLAEGDDPRVTSDSLESNMELWGRSTGGLRMDYRYQEGFYTVVYGPETAEAFTQIRDVTSRYACGLLIGNAILPPREIQLG